MNAAGHNDYVIISNHTYFVFILLGADSAKPQVLLFSATVPFWVREVANRYMTEDKIVVDLIGRQSLKTAVTVEHKAICCPYAERPSTIADVIQVRRIKLVFHCLRYL